MAAQGGELADSCGMMIIKVIHLELWTYVYIFGCPLPRLGGTPKRLQHKDSCSQLISNISRAELSRALSLNFY